MLELKEISELKWPDNWVTGNEIPHFETDKADDFGSECHVYLTEETAIKVYCTDVAAKYTFKQAVKAAKQGVGPKVLSKLLPCHVIAWTREYETLYYITERVTPGRILAKREDGKDYEKLKEEAHKIWIEFFCNDSDFCALNWGVTKDGKIVILDFGPLSSFSQK